MKAKADPSVKATIRHFADMIRGEGISPSMRDIQVAIAVETLREQHGIKVDPKVFDRMIDEDD